MGLMFSFALFKQKYHDNHHLHPQIESWWIFFFIFHLMKPSESPKNQVTYAQKRKLLELLKHRIATLEVPSRFLSGWVGEVNDPSLSIQIGEC